MCKRLAKRLCACLLALGILLGVPVGRVQAAELELAAPSAVLIDAATGTVLYEVNDHERLAPASVTKVMTLLLVLEALDAGKISWDDQVVTSDAAAAKGGSQVYLEPGEQMSMEDMIKSVVVSSANDCATALAEHVAGSESAFVELMNQRAQELGMTDTVFVNCTGLDDGENASEHLTTAYDIALMSRELLTHEEIRKYTTIWMDTVRDGAFGLSNTNKLVRFYDGTTGLKTGFTRGAGYCLSASAKRGDIELIAVVMHCETSPDRFESAKTLLDYGFANYALVHPALEDEKSLQVPVVLGTQQSVQAVVGDATPLLIDKALQAAVTRTIQLEQQVDAPVKKGQQVGTLTIEADGKVLGKIPLVADCDVARMTWGQITVRLLRQACLSGK